MAKIELDQAKCFSPRDCRRCLEACPQRLFRTYPKTARKPGRPAKDWEVAAILPVLCTGCSVCEQVCPNHAIKITAGVASAVTQHKGGIKRAARRMMAG